MADQMIFKRYEIKYMLTAEQHQRLKEYMSAQMIPDSHGESTNLSLYFDTPDFLLARRSMEHPFYKEKLRVRSYGVANANTTVFIELKKKYDSVVYKRRIAMRQDDAWRYLLEHEPVMDTQISREIDYCMMQYQGLAPKILLSYDREAFYDKDNHDFRITFDRNILWRNSDVNLTSGISGESILPEGKVMMEVKTAGAIPLWLVKYLTENQLYKTSYSKYATAYTVLCGGRRPAVVSQALRQKMGVLTSGDPVMDHVS